jgi:GNAT superfamily N-acetyltransferase
MTRTRVMSSFSTIAPRRQKRLSAPSPGRAWERFVRSPQNRNELDFCVALRDARLVGLAESSHRDQGDRSVRYCKLVVDPEFRRQGIGTAALLADLLEIDREDPEISFQATASTEWSGLAFLAKFGFAHIESEIGMRRSRLGVRPEEMADYLAGGVLWIARDASNVVAFCFLEARSDLARKSRRGPGPRSAWDWICIGLDGAGSGGRQYRPSGRALRSDLVAAMAERNK